MGPDASIQKLPASERTLDLSNKQLCFIPVKFSKKSRLATLILSKNQIHELPKNLKKLTALVMSFNGLTEITPDMVDSLGSYPLIESLDFSYNLLAGYPTGATACTKSLKTLNLFGNQITSLDCSLLTNLTFLDLGHNQLTSTPILPETIQTVILDCNKIKDLSAPNNNGNKCNNWKNLTKITRLCISLNRLENIIDPNLTFPVLTTLDISRNNISQLPNLLKVMPHLRQIDASDNVITELPNFPRTISEIIMRNNRIRVLPNNFSQLSCLGSADFSQNQISSIPIMPSVLQTLIIYDNIISSTETSNVPDLFRLYFMNNQLADIPNFKSNSLSEYFLSSNKIKRIDCALLSKSVTRFDVSDNEIEEIPELLFDTTTVTGLGLKLTHLYIGRNRIKKLPKKILESELILLNISENPIEELPEVMPDLLEQFYATNCGLTQIPPPSTEKCELIEINAPFNLITEIPFFNKLLVVNLSNNQLTKLPEFPKTITFIDVSGNSIEEIPSDINYPDLETLDVSFNKLKQLIPETVKLSRLQTLKLKGNPIKGVFKSVNFPSLVYLDITETEIEFSVEKLNPIKRKIEKVSDESDKVNNKSGENEEIDSDSETETETESKYDNENESTATTSSVNATNTINTASIEEVKQREEEKEALMLSKIDRILISKDLPKSDNIFHIASLNRIAYSTHRHERESLEDVIMVNKNEEGVVVTSVFDSRSGGKVASRGSLALKHLMEEEERIVFDPEYFRKLCSCITDVFHDKTAFDGSSFAIVMTKNREVLLATVGDMRIILSTAEKNGAKVVINQQLMQNDGNVNNEIISIDTGRKCGNKTYGQLSISKTVGDYLVYGIDIKPQPMNLEIEEKDRYLIVACATVLEMLSMNQIDEICCKANSANDLAMKLKQATISNMSADNISVVVIDLSC